MKRTFLSHSSSDAVAVEKIAREFIANGVEVWLDKWEIKAGDSIIEKISKGLAANDVLVVFLSKKSVGSRWVARELNVALTAELKTRRTKVIPVLLEDCRIPIFLRDKRYVDLRSVAFEKDDFRGNLRFIGGLEDLVRAIIGDGGVPFYTSSILKAAVVERVDFKLILDRPKPNAGTIQQTMQMVPTRPMTQWRTTVTYFGSIESFSTTLGTITHEDTSRGSRLFKIAFDRIFQPGEKFNLGYDYVLLDNFTSPPTNFWDFSFGVHTLSSAFDFEFGKPISKLEVYKRVSDSEVLLGELLPYDATSGSFRAEYGFLPSDMWLVFRWT